MKASELLHVSVTHDMHYITARYNKCLIMVSLCIKAKMFTLLKRTVEIIIPLQRIFEIMLSNK